MRDAWHNRRMEFREQLSINGESFVHFDTQRGNATAIYKGVDSFLRIGEVSKIKKDILFHKQMEVSGFPVAKFLAEGEFEGMYFFIEESMGERCFGQIFSDEYREFGKISESSFLQFLTIVKIFATAQLSTRTAEKDWEGLRRGVQLERMCGELPQHRTKIEKRYDDIVTQLLPLPFVLTHGDFGPFNIYPKGVIDLEDSFMAPLGYDTISLMTHLDWFPDVSDDPYHKQYVFSEDQKEAYYAMLREVYGNEDIDIDTKLIAAFDFLKGTWFVVGLEKYPELKKFRCNLIAKVI